MRVVRGSGLKLALKGRGLRTLIIRKGHVADNREAKDISGMIGTYRPGRKYITVYRHFSSDAMSLDELFGRIDRIERQQQAMREDIERKIATGEPFDLDGENLFGMNLSGLDLRRLRSVEGADMRFIDVKGTVFPDAMRSLRRSRTERTRFKEAEFL